MKTIPKDQIHTFRAVRSYFMTGGSSKTAYIARWLEKYGLTEEDVRSTIKPLTSEQVAQQGTLGGLKKAGLVDRGATFESVE